MLFTLSIISVIVVIIMTEFGWTNLTGNIRNSLVFETRNKEYGAYEIRQKYSSRLTLSFFTVIGFISVAAIGPKFFHFNNQPKVSSDPIVKIDSLTFSNINKKKDEVKKDEIMENVQKKQQKSMQDVATKKSVDPVAIDIKQKKDSIFENKNAIVSHIEHTGDTTSTEVATNPGDCKDCPKNNGTGGNPPIDNAGILEPSVVTTMAEFKDYKKFIQSRIVYPAEAIDARISGKVHVGFIIDETGKVIVTGIRKSVNPSLDEEAKRVIGLMPNWTPATFNGKPVKVRMSLPVNFVLN